MNEGESVILCEGYYDRAFWAAWLEHLGCTDPGRRPGSSARLSVLDPWGSEVKGKGQYAYNSKSGKFVRIFPCDGKGNVVREMRNRLAEDRDRLAQHASRPRLARLVVSVDPDIDAHGTPIATGLRHEDLHALLRKYDPSAAETEDDDTALFGGATLVSLVRWEAGDSPMPGLPKTQTLERLVCAALVAAYPRRGPAVQTWLDSRPDGPDAGPKEFGWSHMAGWYAQRGCQDFYKAVWEDGPVVNELRSRLTQCGAWRIAQALAK